MIGKFDITIGEVIIYILAGLVIGFVARLLVPGRQHMSLVGTIVLGVISAVIGGIVWNALFPSNDGIAWIGSIIVAVILVWIYGAIAGRGTGTGTARPVRRRPLG
jgi:uncharacterized membrane protein YeaQ/YmgE (transglycosylase-associated protein family)